jgi:hypothetical protein
VAPNAYSLALAGHQLQIAVNQWMAQPRAPCAVATSSPCTRIKSSSHAPNNGQKDRRIQNGSPVYEASGVSELPSGGVH